MEKVNLVAKLGEGSGGLGFFSHSDTVPGDPREWEPWNPYIADGKLYGRASCDMKGPLAASMIAASSVDPAKLRKPIYIALPPTKNRASRHYLQAHSAFRKIGPPTLSFPNRPICSQSCPQRRA